MGATTDAQFSSHGRQPTAAIHIPRRIATTTTTWSGRRTRGVTIGIVEAFAIITAKRLTIAKQLWVIDYVAAKCSRTVLRSSSLETASPRHLILRLRLPQAPRRLLQARPLPQLLRLQLHQAAVKAHARGTRTARRILGAPTRAM